MDLFAFTAGLVGSKSILLLIVAQYEYARMNPKHGSTHSGPYFSLSGASFQSLPHSRFS